MGNYLERCRELRADTTRHYGCAQAVFIPFAEEMGIDTETAYNLSAHFRAGMLQGEVCGAVTGALMALGLAGSAPKSATELMNRVRNNHENMIYCRDLLKKWHGAGHPDRKPHCDAMCFECVKLVEELLEAKNAEQER